MKTDNFGLTDLLSEAQVYESYGHLFVKGELKEARQTGQLAFFTMRKGIFYTQRQLIEYVAKREKRPCENRPLSQAESDNQVGSGNFGISGSGETQKVPISIVAGTTSEESGSVARALERPTLKKPRNS